MNTQAQAVRFDTNEFVFTHGRQPRGFGRWVFEVMDPEDPRRLATVAEYTGNFGEAKFAARCVARTLGSLLVVVTP